MDAKQQHRQACFENSNLFIVIVGSIIIAGSHALLALFYFSSHFLFCSAREHTLSEHFNSPLGVYLVISTTIAFFITATSLLAKKAMNI